MTITLGSTTLVAGQVRSQDGSPIGPTDLVIDLAPGVEIRSYVGADRVTGEHVRCDHGTVTFGATRTFATPEAALAYMRTTFLAEDSAGALKFDGVTVFADAAVTRRRSAVVGCTAHVSYVIEG